MIQKVVSGGQTGADRMGLDWAIWHDIPPTITFGPYTGQKLTVDHIIPRAVAPQLDTLLANLEFMPAHMNFSKGAKIGQRQVDLANKLRHAFPECDDQGHSGQQKTRRTFVSFRVVAWMLS